MDNKEFTKAVSEWVKENGDKPKKEWSPLTNYIGESLIKIVNNFGHNKKFSGYTYLDDMKSEALLTCVKYAYNFDPNKSDNAFAYFTQIAFNAFRMILNKEKLQHDVKYEFISNESSISKHNYNNIMLEDYE